MLCLCKFWCLWFRNYMKLVTVHLDHLNNNIWKHHDAYWYIDRTIANLHNISNRHIFNTTAYSILTDFISLKFASTNDKQTLLIKQFNWWNGLQQILSKALRPHIESLVQDCSISIDNALEILQSCSEPSIYHHLIVLFVASLIPSHNLN